MLKRIRIIPALNVNEGEWEIEYIGIENIMLQILFLKNEIEFRAVFF